jgi:hypothetical protein
MSQQELLKRIAGIFDALGIDYMLTGSLVSSLQGEPRSTHDIDFVISLPESLVSEFASFFAEPDYYADEQSIREAVRRHHTFNIIAINEGTKIDFWMVTKTSFDQSRFSRKQETEFEGSKIKISSPEDTILMKLKWAELSGGSQKQLTDAVRVYEIQYEKLDLEYLNFWIPNLKLQDRWKQLLSLARPIISGYTEVKTTE